MQGGWISLLLVATIVAGCVGNELDDAATQAAVLPGGDTRIPDLRAMLAVNVSAGQSVTLPMRAVWDLSGLAPGTRPPQDEVFVLQPSQLLTNLTWARIDDEPAALPDIDLYEGHVEGDPSRLVRVAATDDWIRGLVLPSSDGAPGVTRGLATHYSYHVIRVGLESNVPAATAGAPVELPTRFDGPGVVYGRDCLEAVPPYAAQGLSPVAMGGEPRYVDLIMDADAEAAERLGDHTFPILVAMIHEVDAIYANDVNVRFRVAGLHQHTEAGYFPSPDDEPPLGVLADYWNQRDDQRDVVHLVTGRESTYAMANCIGGAGHTDIAYTFTPLNWEEDSSIFHMTALAHELGHIFSAHHHYGNHAEQHMASLMIQGYTPGMMPNFSTVSKASIRGWIDAEVPQ